MNHHLQSDLFAGGAHHPAGQRSTSAIADMYRHHFHIATGFYPWVQVDGDVIRLGESGSPYAPDHIEVQAEYLRRFNNQQARISKQ